MATALLSSLFYRNDTFFLFSTGTTGSIGHYLIIGNLVCITRKPFAVKVTKECFLDVIQSNVL